MPVPGLHISSTVPAKDSESVCSTLRKPIGNDTFFDVLPLVNSVFFGQHCVGSPNTSY